MPCMAQGDRIDWLQGQMSGTVYATYCQRKSTGVVCCNYKLLLTEDLACIAANSVKPPPMTALKSCTDWILGVSGIHTLLGIQNNLVCTCNISSLYGATYILQIMSAWRGRILGVCVTYPPPMTGLTSCTHTYGCKKCLHKACVHGHNFFCSSHRISTNFVQLHNCQNILPLDASCWQNFIFTATIFLPGINKACYSS